MKYKVKDVFEKVKLLKPYTTKHEKKVLLASDDTSYIEILEILSDVKASSEMEAIYLILKLREQSVSNVVEGMVNCPKCKTLNEFQIDLEDESNLDYTIPIGVFEDVEEIVNLDDISVLEYNDLQEKINKNNKKLIKLDHEITCRVPNCLNTIPFTLNPRDTISNTTLSNIYQEYFTLGKYLSYSNRDVDELLPFERKILIGLIKKDVEKTPQLSL